MLGTGHIFLRPLRDDDTLSLADLANNRNIWINLRDVMPYPYSVDNAVFFVNLVKNENPVGTFAIDFKGQFCGVISLHGLQDVFKKSAEIGYWIGEPFWGPFAVVPIAPSRKGRCFSCLVYFLENETESHTLRAKPKVIDRIIPVVLCALCMLCAQWVLAESAEEAWYTILNDGNS